MKIQVFVGIVLCGCSGFQKGPQATSAIQGRIKLHTETKGKILAIQKVAPLSCEKLRPSVKVIIKTEKNGTVPTEVRCDLVRGSLITRTKAALPGGNYSVDVYRSRSDSKRLAPLLVSSESEDRDAKSGRTQDLDGAEELGNGMTVRGTVDPSNGRTTHWIKVASTGAPVTLAFSTGNTSTVRARLYALSEGEQVPERVGSLLPGVKKQVQVPAGALFVEVSGAKYSGESSFLVARSDFTGGDSIPVIDWISVGSSSVVLLKPTPGLKVADQIAISAEKGRSGTVQVGKCKVTSLSDDQVSCHMSVSPSGDLRQFKARLIRETPSTGANSEVAS